MLPSLFVDRHGRNLRVRTIRPNIPVFRLEIKWYGPVRSKNFRKEKTTFKSGLLGSVGRLVLNLPFHFDKPVRCLTCTAEQGGGGGKEMQNVKKNNIPLYKSRID